jgi:16S rRNA processing protein RimM
MEVISEDQKVESISISGDAYLPVGKVSRPHGIKGEIKVNPYSGDPASLTRYPTVVLTLSGREPLASYRVESGKVQGRVAILRLEGIDSRNEAESLAGHELWVERVHLPPLSAEEFYWQEMKGRRVITTDGRDVGEVTGLLTTGAHDILVIANGTREILIPAIREFMVEIREETGTIVVKIIPGLLEMNE